MVMRQSGEIGSPQQRHVSIVNTRSDAGRIVARRWYLWHSRFKISKSLLYLVCNLPIVLAMSLLGY